MFAASATVMVTAVAVAVFAATGISTTIQTAYTDKPNQFYSISNSQFCFTDFFTGEDVCQKSHSNFKSQIKTK